LSSQRKTETGRMEPVMCFTRKLGIGKYAVRFKPCRLSLFNVI
jgi:hypothetical protein